MLSQIDLMSARGKKIYVVRLFLVVILMLSIHFIYAQSISSSISGLVHDKSGQPVSQASILLRGTSYVGSSDDAGRFKINVPAGTYSLIISRVGFLEQVLQVKIVQDQNLVINTVKLTSLSDLKEVEVKGKTANTIRKEQAFNVNVIDLKGLYNTSGDLNQVLTKTSGVRVREDGGLGSNFTFSLNGFSGRQVKFFLDGIPMDNFGSSLTLNNFPVNMAERIEIYKGVLPVELGADALGGAVNLITRTNPNYLDASYGFGSFNTHKASVNHAYTNQKSGLTLKTNVFYNFSDNNYKVKVSPIALSGENAGQRLPEQEVERFHDGYESATIQFEGGVTGKKYADKLLVGLIASGNDKDIQTGVVMDQVFGGRTSNSSALIPTLKYKKSDLFAAGLDLSLYTAYNMSTNRFIDTTRLKYNWLQEVVPTSTAELNRTQLKNKDNEGLVTANLAYRLSNLNSLAFNYVLSDFRRKSSDVENPDNVTFKYPQKLNKHVMGLAWQHKSSIFSATLFSKLYLLNAESFEQVQNGTAVPTYAATSTETSNVGYGAAAAYFILPELQAKASYEHTYRLPEAVELLGDGLYVRRNSALKPESSDNINVGALYSFDATEDHRFGLELNYLFRNAKDYIRIDQRQSQPVDRQYINIGDVVTHGIEGELRYNWKNQLRSSFNVTYQDIIDKEKFLTSTNLTGTTTSPNLGYGFRIPNIPYLFANADVDYTFSKVGAAGNTLTLSYSLNFVEKYYFTPSQLGSNNQDVIPAQFAHNVAVNYVLNSGRYNIALECRNLADNDLFDNYKLQKPGRSVFLKLRYFISK